MFFFYVFFARIWYRESHTIRNKWERGVFMNRKREAYDRLAVGDRIRKKRVQLGFSQDEVAERIEPCTEILFRHRAWHLWNVHRNNACDFWVSRHEPWLYDVRGTDRRRGKTAGKWWTCSDPYSFPLLQATAWLCNPAFEIIYCIYADFPESVIMNHAPGNSRQIFLE